MRRALDFYETPPWQTRALQTRVSISGSVFEPCVGDGSLLRELRDCQTSSNDINRERTANFHRDASLIQSWVNWPIHFDWVVTNPPFNRATEILECALPHARCGVIFLLRLSFLEPTERRQHIQPPSGLIVLPRWSYKQNGKTDSVTTAWMIWFKGGVHAQLDKLSFPIQIVPKSEMQNNEPIK